MFNATDLKKEKQNLFEGIQNKIDTPVSKKNVMIFLYASIGIVLLELSAYLFGGPLTILASRIWFVAGIIYTAGIVAVIAKTIIQDVQSRSILSLIILGLVSFLILFNIGNPYIMDFNYEACQQVAAGLNKLHSPTLGYTETAFLGYPARQYLITAIPSLFVGKNALGLHLGFALPFLTGLFIFYAGLRRYFAHKWQAPAIISALTILSFFTFPYLLEFARVYEQVILPISFTLHAFGWLLLLADKITIYRAAGLMWIGAILATTYTPALACWALLILVLGLIIISIHLKKKNGIVSEDKYSKETMMAIISVLIYVAGIGLASFISRGDRTTEVHEINYFELIDMVIKGLSSFFFNAPAVFVGLMLLPVAGYMIYSLTMRMGLFHFIISLWTVAVVVSSVALHGYAAPDPVLSLHRAMVVIPPLMMGITYAVCKKLFTSKFTVKPIHYVAVFILLSGFSLWNLVKENEIFIPKYSDRPKSYIVQDMVNTSRVMGVAQDDPFNIVYITNDIMMSNIKTYTGYLFPNADVRVLYEDKTFPLDLDLSKGLMVYADKSTYMPSTAFELTGWDTVEEYIMTINKVNQTVKKIILPPKGKTYISESGVKVLNTLSAEDYNLDFEKAVSGQALGWRKIGKLSSQTSLDNNIKKSGNSSLKMTLFEADDCQYVRDITVKPNTTYSVKVWIKTENVVSAIGNGYGPTLNVKLPDNTYFYYLEFPKGTTDWQQVGLTFQTPEDVTKVEIQCRLGWYGNHCTGTAWFDNLTISEIQK